MQIQDATTLSVYFTVRGPHNALKVLPWPSTRSVHIVRHCSSAAQLEQHRKSLYKTVPRVAPRQPSTFLPVCASAETHEGSSCADLAKQECLATEILGYSRRCKRERAFACSNEKRVALGTMSDALGALFRADSWNFPVRMSQEWQAASACSVAPVFRYPSTLQLAKRGLHVLGRGSRMARF